MPQSNPSSLKASAKSEASARVREEIRQLQEEVRRIDAQRERERIADERTFLGRLVARMAT